MKPNPSSPESPTKPAPEPPSPHAAENRALTPLWLFIVGFFVIESILHVLPEGAMTRTLRHRTEEILYLPATQLQFMGDSATNAIRVPLIEHFLQQPHEISNYALPGTTPLFSYFMLERQIAAGRVPKVIIFAPHPFTWGDSFMDRFIGRFAQPWESARLLKDGVQLDDWIYGTFCRMSYTLRYREELYKMFTQGDTAFIKSWREQIVSVQNTRAKITDEEKQPLEPTASVLDPNNLPPILSRPITIHPYNEIYLDKFCDLAEKHHIQIVWLTLPIPELLMKRVAEDKRAEMDAVYTAFLKRMGAKHANLHPLSPSIHTQPDHHYRDPWHLNAYGASIFSRRAGELLAAWLKENPIK